RPRGVCGRRACKVETSLSASANRSRETSDRNNVPESFPTHRQKRRAGLLQLWWRRGMNRRELLAPAKQLRTVKPATHKVQSIKPEGRADAACVSQIGFFPLLPRWLTKVVAQ